MAIASQINTVFKDNECQLGFQSIVGTETAIVKHFGGGQKLSYVVVLDFKSSFDRVSQDLLMREASQMLTANTTNMISAILQPMAIRTDSDATNAIG